MCIEINFAESVLIFSVFLLVEVFFTYSAFKYKRSNKLIYIILSVIAILFASIFACVRAENVGTDVKTYAKPLFEIARSSKTINSFVDNISGYIKNGYSSEIGYLIMVYVSTHLFCSLKGVLFFTALFQIVPVYLVAARNSDKIPAQIVMLIYYCVFYLMGFNIMKQCIAASFILLMYFQYQDKHYCKAVICFLVASSFHSSAIFGVLFSVVGAIFSKLKKRSFRNLLTISIVVILSVIMINWVYIVSLGVDIGIFDSRMAMYISKFTGTDIGEQKYMFVLDQVIYSEFVFKILFFIIPFLFIRRDKKQFDGVSDIFAICFSSICFYVLFFFLFHSGYGYRITVYAEYFNMIWISKAYSMRSFKGEEVSYEKYSMIVTPNTCIICFMVIFYMMYEYLFLGWHGINHFGINLG